MKKIIAFLTACTLGLPCLLISAEAASSVSEEAAALQAPVIEDTDPYTFYMVPERTSVTAEEVQNGDVSIRVKVYLRGDREPIKQIAGLGIQYESSSDALYFSNSSNVFETTSDLFQQTYSGGSFLSEYVMPTCFGEVTSSGTYAPDNYSCLTSAQLTEPFSGSTIRSDGAGGIYFTRSYNKLVDGEKTRITNEKVEIAASELQQNADGTVSFTYEYYKQSADEGYPLCTNTCTIPKYDATLAAGTALDGYHNAYTFSSQDGVSFLGYADEFPVFAFDVVIRQGTSDGIYTVSFIESECSLSTVSNTHLPVQVVGTAIAVGSTSATIINDASNVETICAFAENDRPLTLAQFSNVTITGQVTYADNTIKSQSLQNALTADTTPAALYADSDTSYVIQNIPFYCGSSTTTVTQYNAASYTKKVLIGKKGDANLDGTVDVQDAVCVLTYYAKKAAGQSPKLQDSFTEDQETLAYFLADIDTNSKNQGGDGGLLSVEDAVKILTYYAKSAAGQMPIWNNRW